MARQFILNERDKQLIQAVLDRLRNTPNFTALRPTVPDLPDMAPEVYVALVPSVGMPSRSGASMGGALCNIYQTLPTGSLEYAGFQLDVWNPLPEALSSGTYIAIAREKYGRWLVMGVLGNEGPGTGTGTGSDEPNPCGDGVTVEETDLRCEDGDLNLYSRTVTLNIHQFTGCLTKETGDYSFVRTVACCDPTCAETGTGTATGPIGTGSCAFGCYTVDFRSLTLASLQIVGDVLVLEDWEPNSKYAGVRFLPDGGTNDGRTLPTKTTVELLINGDLAGWAVTIGLRGECDPPDHPYTRQVIGALTMARDRASGPSYTMMIYDSGGTLAQVPLPSGSLGIGSEARIVMDDDGASITLSVYQMPAVSLIEQLVATSTENALDLGVQTVAIFEESAAKEVAITKMEVTDGGGLRWRDYFNDANGTLLLDHLPDIGCQAWYCLEPPEPSGTGTGTADTLYWFCFDDLTGTAAGTGTGSPSDYTFTEPGTYELCLDEGTVIDIECIGGGAWGALHGGLVHGGTYALRVNVTPNGCLQITVAPRGDFIGSIPSVVADEVESLCIAQSGAGGGGSLGDIVWNGGQDQELPNYGGGGGGAGGPDAPGGDGALGPGGAGGTSSFGRGGDGSPGAGLQAEDGEYPGGGGGIYDGLDFATGGIGAAGRVRIWIVG